MLYSNSLHNGFVLDDYIYFFSKGNIAETSFSSLFIKGYRTNYRPLGFAFLKLEYDLFKENPVGYHLVNILLFGAVCCLFFFTILKLFQNFELALLASILFAAHPINHFLIDYKSASMLILFVVFSQICVLTAIKSLESNKTVYYILSLLFYFLCLLFHEIGFILPFYVLVFFHFQKNVPLKRNLIFCASYIFAFALFAFIRFQLTQLKPVDTLLHLNIPLGSFLTTSFYSISWYLTKLILPGHMIFVFATPLITTASWLGTITCVVAILLFFYLLFGRWRRGPLACSLALFGAGFIPFIPAGWVYLLEYKTVIIETHWFCYSSVGFFILLAYSLLKLKARWNPAFWYVVISLLLLCFSLLTRYYNWLWRDAETYFSYVLTVNPCDTHARLELANAYLAKHHKGFNRRAYQNDEEIKSLIKACQVLGLHSQAERYSSLL